MIARLNGEARGNRRRVAHRPPDGYLWVAKRHLIPADALEWRNGEWLPTSRAGLLCRKASSHCAPEGSLERPIDPNESEYQRRPVGWRALACAIIEQAADDLHAYRAVGLIKDGQPTEWPRVRYRGGRIEPKWILGGRDTSEHVKLLDWWLSETPEMLADLAGVTLDISDARRALGVTK